MVELRCDCGSFQGEITEVSDSYNKRIVCLCIDCQAYAHYLNRTDSMLDIQGGTEVVPVHPARIKILRGKEKMTSVRLSDDGIIRWYTLCCMTPIANTQPGARLPFAGVIHTIIRSSDLLGPIEARINGKYGIPPLIEGTSLNTPFRVIINILKFMAVGFAKNLHRPSPFFHTNGQAVAIPEVLSDDQYDQLVRRCGPNPIV